MGVTTLEEIKNKFEQEVDITGFEEGDSITLKLRHINLLDLIASGKIPNTLMNTAATLFGDPNLKTKIDEKDESNGYINFNNLLDIICNNVLVTPSFDELKEYLTDQQKLEIFYFSQGGIRKIQKFREQQANIERISNEQNLQNTTE